MSTTRKFTSANSRSASIDLGGEVVGANIRVLRQRNGWTQAELGALMGWQEQLERMRRRRSPRRASALVSGIDLG